MTVKQLQIDIAASIAVLVALLVLGFLLLGWQAFLGVCMMMWSDNVGRAVGRRKAALAAGRTEL